MSQPFTIVDAFTDRPFAGNPASVCILSAPAAEPWMKAVAREMNLSETAFLHREGDGWRLRWFTPALEVDLCGHATLASAHVLWEEGHLAAGARGRFFTRGGVLSAETDGSWITLDFPSKPPGPCAPPEGIEKAIGARAVSAGRNEFDLLIEVESEKAVRGLKPDFRALATFPVRGVMVTARAEMPGFDFVSRFFGPACGIPEDPVTGSAHCCLGPFWGSRLKKSELLAYQASARGGTIRVGLRGERVLLGGQAVTVSRGEILHGKV